MEWVIFDNVLGAHMEVSSGWQALVDMMMNPPKHPTKTKCKLLKLCSFGSVRTPKKSLRHDANVTAVTGIEGDYDGGVMSIDRAAQILSAFGIEAVLHTTPSHTEARPRWRVLAPLSRSYTPDQRQRFITVLDALLGGILSTESFTLSQTFYFGAVDGSDYQVRKINGKFIDAM